MSFLVTEMSQSKQRAHWTCDMWDEENKKRF